MPRNRGAPELDLLSQLGVTEGLPAADGSVGWCVMIGCDSGYLGAFLEPTSRARYVLFRTAGGDAIYASGPLDRAFRDIHSAAQHPLVSLRSYEIAGRALLGASRWDTFSS
jgi:hypothetical protein